MIDKKTVERIISAVCPKKGEIILEIGPGHGELTRFLRKSEVIAIEKDIELYKSLKLRIVLIHGNALKEIKKHKFDRIVSNLPYSICEPLFQLLPSLEWKEAYFTIPRRFASLLSKPPYSFLFTTKILFDVPKEAFSPRPGTESVFVHVSPKDSLMKIIFIQRKTKLKNAIMRALFISERMTKNQSREALKTMELNTLMEKRVDGLQPSDFLVVEKALEKFK